MGKGVLGWRDGGRECGGRRGRLVSGLREGSDRLDVARLRGGRVRVHVVRERAWRVEVALRLSGVACGLCRLVVVVVLDLRRWLLLAERDAREQAQQLALRVVVARQRWRLQRWLQRWLAPRHHLERDALLEKNEKSEIV